MIFFQTAIIPFKNLSYYIPLKELPTLEIFFYNFHQNCLNNQ